MKLRLAVIVVAGVLVTALHAQDEVYSEPPPADAVVYQAPVTYQVPVVYQAPVIYQSSVTFQAPVSYDPSPAGGYYPATPNVIYVAGPGSCGPNFTHYPRYYSPNVIYFGHGEAYQRGYHFRHCR